MKIFFYLFSLSWLLCLPLSAQELVTLSGKVTDEKGRTDTVGPGDTLITSSGEGHSLLAVGEEPLVYLAAIIFQGE